MSAIEQSLAATVAGDANGRDEALARLTTPAVLSQERLPMLEVVLDRVVRLLTTTVRQLTSRNVRVSLEDHVVRRFGDALAEVEAQSLIAVIHAEEWDNKFLLTGDASMIYSCVEVLLGGKMRSVTRVDAPRSFSLIERRLSERLLNLVKENLEEAFKPVSPVSFVCERLETNPEFTAICRENNPSVCVTLRLDFGNAAGKIGIILPYATLEPIRNLLLQVFMGEKFGRDPVWERHLRSEIERTRLDLVGVLHERMMPLGDLTKWKVGMTIPLNATTKMPARLLCNGTCLFHGEMGQANGNIAVMVESATDARQEFIDALVSD